VVSQLPSTYYRILRSRPQSVEDLESVAVRRMHDVQNGHRPRRIPDTGDALHMWSGISVYSSEDTARANALYWRERGHDLGGFIARLQVPPEPGKELRYEKTSDDFEHYTIWASPSTLSTSIDAIMDV
jgi:hypothetical protein